MLSTACRWLNIPLLCDSMTDYSIKLGLGDFVFYSVLVSRASMYGFCTGVICALIIVGVS